MELPSELATLITGLLAVGAAYYGARKVLQGANIQATESRNSSAAQIKSANDIARRERQDRVKPVCVLMPYDGVDPWEKRDLLLAASDKPPVSPNSGFIELRGVLRNVGLGPALDLVIILRILEGSGITTAPSELAPLHAGESRGNAKNPLHIPIKYSDHFNNQDLAILGGRQWQIIFQYKDIFGNTFHSVHHKTPRQLNKLYGSVSVDMPQTWVTFGEGAFSG